MVLDRVGSGYVQVAGVLNAVMNLRVPQNAGYFFATCKPVSFSIRTLFHEVSKHLAKAEYMSC
jgi:hypothetical protein